MPSPTWPPTWPLPALRSGSMTGAGTGWRTTAGGHSADCRREPSQSSPGSSTRSPTSSPAEEPSSSCRPPQPSVQQAGRYAASSCGAGALQAVIALPPGSLPTTGISLHLWVLRKPRPGETAGQVLFIDSTTAAQQAGPEFAAVRQMVRRAWSAYLAASGKAERPGESGTVPAIDLLDDEVDLTPGSRLRPAPGGTAIEPRDLVDAAAEIRATLGTLGDSLPRLRVAGRTTRSRPGRHWKTSFEAARRRSTGQARRPCPGLASPEPGTSRWR